MEQGGLDLRTVKDTAHPVPLENRCNKYLYAIIKPKNSSGGTMKSAYLEQLKSDIAARFERDLRKPRAKSALKSSTEEDAALEQQKQNHFARLLMAEALRQLK